MNKNPFNRDDIQLNNYLKEFLKDNQSFEQIKEEFCDLFSKRIGLISIYDLNHNQSSKDIILQTLFNGLQSFFC